VGDCEPMQAIQAGVKSAEEVRECYYLGSVIAKDSSCGKYIKTRLDMLTQHLADYTISGKTVD